MDIIEKFSSVLEEVPNEKLESFYEWGKVVQLVLNDNYSFFVDFQNNQELIVKKGFHDNPDFQLKTDVNILVDILKGVQDPVEAVVQGKVVIEGSLTEALVFAELIMEIKDIYNKEFN